ncbi:MAG: hydroxymethylbilane synthase [Chitinophagaceae bacterium]|nr:hydroxymethylbilane synthase [Chitinophagaceae bacterium]
MIKNVRTGTRESPLAMAQAHIAAALIRGRSVYEPVITGIRSMGDKNLITPLYEMGVEGVFTRELDSALLNHEIDIAVHSYKDVPTIPAAGLCVAAVLERATALDVLVFRNEESRLRLRRNAPVHIASSSIRRKAQWLHRYPQSVLYNIRGNVGTRLHKLQDAHWDGAIFAAAGLERLQLSESDTGPCELLHWMLPAPAQGAIAILCREDDEAMQQLCALLNHTPSRICTETEKLFLRQLGGGCSTPVAAFATITGNTLTLNGNITAIDGSHQLTVQLSGITTEYKVLASEAARQLIARGAHQLLTA